MRIEDNELRELFRTESAERLQSLESGLVRLEKDPASHGTLEEVFREAHSLKGEAKMIGVTDVELLAHRFEDFLGSARRGGSAVTPDVIDRLLKGIDALRRLVNHAVTGEPSGVSVGDALKQLEGVSAQSPIIGEKAEDAPAPEKGEAHHADVPTVETEKPAGPPASATQVKPYKIETIRVETGRLDTLVTLAGELTVARTRLSHRLADVEDIETLWEEMKRDQPKPQGKRGWNGAHLGADEGQDRKRERSDRVGHLLERLRNEVYEDNARIDILSSEIGENVRTIRLLPFSTIFGLFPRMVRDMAREHGKDIQLILEGGDTNADKRILEEMKDPVTHMVRNAIGHGIEPPEEREKSGKPRSGSIRLKAYKEGSKIVVEVSDDGRGLDAEAIGKAVVKRKIATGEEISTMTPEQVESFIFTSGFSTSAFVTETSGRGVGLDVVRANVERLKGTVSLENRRGAGLCVRTLLPLTLATTRILLARAGGVLCGVPVESVRGALFVKRGDVFTLDGRAAMLYEGRPLSVAWLADLLETGAGVKKSGAAPSKNPCVIISSRGESLGLLLDELVDEQEVALKPQGALLKRVRNVSGVAILGTGEICVILNPGDLVKSCMGKPTAVHADDEAAPLKKPAILLVEDSVLTRTLEKRILEDAGYEVETAVDGADALGRLGLRKFDAVVSDILMPNMDGLALTENMRKIPEYRETPVILVTSLASDEDRKRGLHAGANAYIAKPSFDQKVFLETVRRLA